MKIGILEYHYHKVYVDTLKQVCSDHDVTVFDNVRDAKKGANDLDLLFVNTIQPVPWDIIRWVRFKPKCKTIWTIHEVNSDFRFSRILLKKFDAINVTFPPLKDYIVKEKLYKGKVFTIPFMLHEKCYPDTNGMHVVPGRIEKFRRNYDSVFKMISKNQKWCLLGEPIGTYGKEIIEKCKEYNKRGYNIRYFTDFVPENIYEDILKGCNCIISPLRGQTIGTNRLCKEVYGKTKICGAFFEAIKYGKPFISDMEVEADWKKYLLKDWKKYFEDVVLKEVFQ